MKKISNSPNTIVRLMSPNFIKTRGVDSLPLHFLHILLDSSSSRPLLGIQKIRLSKTTRGKHPKPGTILLHCWGTHNWVIKLLIQSTQILYWSGKWLPAGAEEGVIARGGLVGTRVFYFLTRMGSHRCSFYNLLSTTFMFHAFFMSLYLSCFSSLYY